MDALQLQIHSAQDLKDVKILGSMHTYVVAWIQRAHQPLSEPIEKSVTSLDENGGTNPSWNSFKIALPITPESLHQPNNFLLLQIYCGSQLRDKLVGSVAIPFSQFTRDMQVDSQGFPLCFSWQRATCNLRRPSGRFQGTLSFSFRFKIHPQQDVSAPIARAPSLSLPPRNSVRKRSTRFETDFPMFDGGRGSNSQAFQQNSSSGGPAGVPNYDMAAFYAIESQMNPLVIFP